jgi:hypothetical protein
MVALMRALLIASTFAAAFMASAGVGHLGAQYINGPAPLVTAGQFCAEMRGWIGMQRAGHTLRSVQCSGGGHEFTVHIKID